MRGGEGCCDVNGKPAQLALGWFRTVGSRLAFEGEPVKARDENGGERISVDTWKPCFHWNFRVRVVMDQMLSSF